MRKCVGRTGAPRGGAAAPCYLEALAECGHAHCADAPRPSRRCARRARTPEELCGGTMLLGSISQMWPSTPRRRAKAITRVREVCGRAGRG
ncbi:hypothetical protein PIB30_103575, partial [Stylosanthes scabra]|nr:hypothetical protein [Stylosanthes scabra]